LAKTPVSSVLYYNIGYYDSIRNNILAPGVVIFAH